MRGCGAGGGYGVASQGERRRKGRVDTFQEMNNVDATLVLS